MIHVTRKSTTGELLLVLLIISMIVACPKVVHSQAQEPTIVLRPEPVRQTNEVSGNRLFESYCAVCHGEDGKGHGAAAPALKTPPADLTVLARNNAGRFPANHVMDVLNAGADFTTHESKEMPLWAPIFRSMSANQSVGILRAKNVTEYIRSIQEK